MMARPIKETPVVYGKNAVRILKEMENPKPLSMERMERIKRACMRLNETRKEASFIVEI
jgi:hypothetical protein